MNAQATSANCISQICRSVRLCGLRCPVDINGFEYEIREASRCVKLGRTGSDRYTPQDSLALTHLMYDIRMSWGMKFAGEV